MILFSGESQKIMATWEMIVRGRVQGVGFRWFVKRLALELGVCGYVRNLPDSTVFIIAQASQPVLLSFVDQIKLGSHRSTVLNVDVSPLEHASEYYGFEIR